MEQELMTSTPVDGASADEHVISDLARHLTHHLRNSLSVIMTAASQLNDPRDTVLSDDHLSLVDAILQAADRMEGTLSRFTQYACPEPPLMESVNLNELCRAEADQSCHRLAGNSPLTVTCHFDDRLPEVVCDPTQIRLLLANLIDNAIQASGIDRAVILRTTHDQTSVTVTIEDSGPGIPEAVADRAFMPFVTTHPGKAGLGLAIACRLAAGHHGTIAVRPSPAGGVAVAVTLPLSATLSERGKKCRRF
jgi:two-component system sensor histidine kinase HydH